MHLHIVFVLLYAACCCQCSFMCGRCSIFYVCVTCCDLDVTIRLSERACDKARGNNNSPLHVPSKRKEEIRSGTCGCVSFVVPYFQPATSIDRLHLALRAGLEVGKPYNIPANNKQAPNGHSHRGQRKRTLTERHTEYNNTNTMCRCTRLHSC